MTSLSLVVPTYNRAELLAKALETFVKQSLPPEQYEIIVVDNNSHDRTRQVFEEAAARHPDRRWRYHFERNQGLHFARNRGILMAQSDVVVFGDDDIAADAVWLESIADEFSRNTRAGIVGGKVKPAWNAQPEPWIYDYGTEKIHPVFAYLDHGDERIVLSDNQFVYGCNFSIRRELALRCGGSYPDVFPRALKHLSGTGEYGLTENVRALGYQVVYRPDALVHHAADSSRANLDYFIDRYERWAIEIAYDRFRKKEKLAAARELIGSAVRQLRQSRTLDPAKRNPAYFSVIQRRSALTTLKQVMRVLVDRSLYRHIRQESYLSSM